MTELKPGKLYPSNVFAFGKHCNYFASHTINMQRFTGLNIRRFSPMKFFAGRPFAVPWPAVFIV